MSGPVPPFLLALELGLDADERTIRRAYARRLKLVDAEADPAGFQALRETLEAALRWAAWRDRATAAEAPASTPQPESAPPADPPGTPAPSLVLESASPLAPAIEPEPDPVSAAGEPAFADFHARLERGVESPEQAGALLDAALQDERLVNLEARTFFEWRVAGLLAGGWRPGHELLFWPAAVAFGWDTDRRRLALFGTLGAFMDAAIRERLVFFAQDATPFDEQRRLIQRLRVDEPVGAVDLVTDMPRLAVLLQHFPHWSRAMTQQGVVQRWIDAWNALGPQEREATPRRAPPPPAASREAPRGSGSRGRMGWGLVVLALILFRGFAGVGNGGPAPHSESSTPAHEVPAESTPPAAAQPGAPPPTGQFELHGQDGTQPTTPPDAPAATSAPGRSAPGMADPARPPKVPPAGPRDEPAR